MMAQFYAYTGFLTLCGHFLLEFYNPDGLFRGLSLSKEIQNGIPGQLVALGQDVTFRDLKISWTKIEFSDPLGIFSREGRFLVGQCAHCMGFRK